MNGTNLEDLADFVCVYVVFVVQEAIISPVSPDVLYLFRVQAVCMNDMRSDFSQSMLFRGNTLTHTHTLLRPQVLMNCRHIISNVMKNVNMSVSTYLFHVHSPLSTCCKYCLTFV